MRTELRVGIIIPGGKRYADLAEEIAGGLKTKGALVETSVIETGDPNAAEILSGHKDQDILIVFDLAGFEAETLTGGRSYNLSNAKQVHVLLADTFANEKYLADPLSIALFFYCADMACYERLMECYPEIPFLKLLGEETTISLVSRVFSAVDEVCEICHIR